MNKNFIFCTIFITLTIFGCATKSEKYSSSEISNKNEKKESSEEDRLNKKIYYFQHKLISHWVFESEGRFFSAMKSGDSSKFMAIASSEINPDYAKGITITPIDDKDAFLIVFPEPKEMALCYFAVVEKVGSSYRYITYEKTFSLGRGDVYGVVGGWGKDGGHDNYGSRTYKTSKEFIKDVLDL